MTTTTMPRSTGRISAVVKMQLINRETYIWIPLIILGGAFGLSLIVYALLTSTGIDDVKYGGAGQAPLWYFLVVGVQALTLTFPFSQAMSVTRREFYLGTLLAAALTSTMLAVISVIGGFIERATDGWGMNGWFFALPWIWEAGPLGAFVLNFVVAMLFFVVGFWAATIFKRFGVLWLTLVLVGVALLLIGGGWLVTVVEAWPGILTFIASLNVISLSLWVALLTVVLAAIAFVTLRRALP